MVAFVLYGSDFAAIFCWSQSGVPQGLGLFAWLNGRCGIKMKAEILSATGMTLMSLRFIATTVAIVVGLLWCRTSIALPPLGLTQIRIDEDRSARFAVIDGVAYASTSAGVFPIDAAGVQPVLVPAPSGFGPLIQTTRVLKSDTGRLVFAATFDREQFSSSGGVALDLSDLQNPLVVWNFGGRVRAINSTLGGISSGRILLNDGSIVNTGASEFFFSGADMTASGVAIGDATIPGTAGGAPALRTQVGEITILGSFGEPGGVKQRSDDQSLNYGYSENWFTVVYGGSTEMNIDESIGRMSFGGSVHVSETDFVVVEASDPDTLVRDFLAYYPGINPAGRDRSVPLGDLFPELSTIDFDYITDISSSEGQIHMLLSGDDGLWLFAARDPSVVPEPSTVCLGALLMVGFAALRLRRG